MLARARQGHARGRREVSSFGSDSKPGYDCDLSVANLGPQGLALHES